jgi:DNA-directed RNA polymerase
VLKCHQSAVATPLVQPQPVPPVIPANNIQTTATVTLTDTPNMESTAHNQLVEEPLVIPSNQIFMGKKMPDIEEQIAIMLVCLKSGHIDRAHTILKNITKHKPIQRSRFFDVNLHNAFIEAYIMQKGRPNTRQALYWFDDMKKTGAKPNVTTYAILIKGMLR